MRTTLWAKLAAKLKATLGAATSRSHNRPLCVIKTALSDNTISCKRSPVNGQQVWTIMLDDRAPQVYTGEHHIEELQEVLKDSVMINASRSCSTKPKALKILLKAS